MGLQVQRRGNSLETPNVWGLSSFHPNVSKQPPPPQCLGFCLLFTPRLLSRRAGSDVDATTAVDRTQKPRRCHVSTGRGTLLAFQLLVPVFTNDGSCDGVTRTMTQILLLLLAASSFLACFTDSFRSLDGNVYHGLASPRGMWLFDYPTASTKALPDLSNYRVRFMDFVHGLLSVLVFGVVVIKDKNVASCFYPQPGQETKEILRILPLVVGVICSLLSVVFPTKRRGIGYSINNER